MILDLLAAVLITYAFYRGYNKGLINTVVDTVSIIIGIVVALKFSPMVIDRLQNAININPAFEFILGFLIVFFLVMLLLRFIGERIEDLLRTIKINFINQIAGGLLLGFVVAFIIGSLFLLLSDLNILSDSYTDQSTLYEHLINVREEGDWIIEKGKTIFSEFWQRFMSTLDSVKSSSEVKKI